MKSEHIEQKSTELGHSLGQFERLSAEVQDIILSFCNNKIGEKKFKAASRLYKNKDQIEGITNLYSNINVLFADQAARIAYNLLWQIDVEKTLQLAAEQPERLFYVVEIKDPHGQRIRGTPLQIVYAAGDRNTREMKPEEKQYGLVERLRPCFKDPNVYDDQLKAWDLSKEASETTMAPYKKAIETLCQDIIASNDITRKVRFEKLLELPMANKFRDALKPDPDHVVTSGFLFDMQIFQDLFLTWKANVDNAEVRDKNRANLNGWYSLKSDVLAAIVVPALQARCQRCDMAIFKSGIHYVSDGKIPARLDYSKGIPDDVKAIGTLYFLGLYGDRWDRQYIHYWREAKFAGFFGPISALVLSKISKIGIPQSSQLEYYESFLIKNNFAPKI